MKKIESIISTVLLVGVGYVVVSLFSGVYSIISTVGGWVGSVWDFVATPFKALAGGSK